MAEIGQLCKIEFDENTIYKIIDVRIKIINIVSLEAITSSSNTFVDLVEVENINIKKINIPVFNIHVITE